MILNNRQKIIYEGFSGEKYIGIWKNGEYHGQGVYTFSDGTRWEGEWKDDIPWNITELSIDGRINGKIINGVQEKFKK